MKFLAVSDPHTDWRTLGVPRYREIDRLMHQAVDAAIVHKVDGFFFLGDLCDPDNGPDVLRALVTAVQCAQRLARDGCPSFWLAGNHDVVETTEVLTTLSPLRALGPYVHVMEQVSLWDTGEYMVLGFPYQATSSQHLPYEQAVRDFKQRLASYPVPSVVISHLMIPGIQPGSETTDMSRGRSLVFPRELLRGIEPEPLLLSGHYHRGQVFDGIHVVGSLARLTMGERDNDPGYLVIEVPPCDGSANRPVTGK